LERDKVSLPPTRFARCTISPGPICPHSCKPTRFASNPTPNPNPRANNNRVNQVGKSPFSRQIGPRANNDRANWTVPVGTQVLMPRGPSSLPLVTCPKPDFPGKPTRFAPLLFALGLGLGLGLGRVRVRGKSGWFARMRANRAWGK
jgi:hypothetical protein